MFEVNTLNRAEVGQVFRRRLEGEDKTLELPRCAIQRGKINKYDQLSNDVFGANEFYAELNSASLRDARDDGFALRFRRIDENVRKSPDSEFDFCFLNYTDAHRITRMEAYQMVGILGEYSDYLTTPMQSTLVHAINEDNGLEDWAYNSLYTGTELFLQGCVDNHPEKPIMGGLPQLDIQYLEDLINLYENYGVEAFYIDFQWQLPIRQDKTARLRYLMRRVANQRFHEDILFYGINMRPASSAEIGEDVPAANLAPVLMMIDIIGGNHRGPRIPSEIDMDDREGFRLYDDETSEYHVHDVPGLTDVWPDESELDVERVVEQSMGSYRQRNRYEALANAELMEMDLARLRWCLDNGLEAEFYENKDVPRDLLDAGATVREAFEEGFQADIGDFT